MDWIFDPSCTNLRGGVIESEILEISRENSFETITEKYTFRDPMLQSPGATMAPGDADLRLSTPSTVGLRLPGLPN